MVHGYRLYLTALPSKSSLVKVYKLGLILTRNCHNLTRIFTPGIETPKVSTPGGPVDDSLVDEFHEKYIQALKKLFADNSDEEGRELHVI
jgi:hypothetical protein